jgi:hypothetical protein
MEDFRIASPNLVGKWVTYWGSTDEWHGKEFQIIDQGKEVGSRKIAFLPFGSPQPVWRTLGSSFSEPYDKVVDNTAAISAINDMLFNPHAETKRVIDTEIDRLRARIAELESAKKVLDTL